jgi:hypothetical protein
LNIQSACKLSFVFLGRNHDQSLDLFDLFRQGADLADIGPIGLGIGLAPVKSLKAVNR